MRKQTIQTPPTIRFLLAFTGVLLSFMVVCLTPAHAFAQSSQDSSTAGATSSSDAAILQELERMRARIQELEAQLRQRNADAQQNPVASQPEMLQVTNTSSASSALSLIQKSGQSVTESIGQTATAEPSAPFAWADWTWLNGNPRTKQPAFDSKFFTPEIRADVAYHYDFNHPKDDTISGSSEVFRSNEVSLTHLGIGGDFHYDHVRARVFTQLGLYSTATPRNDASYSRGQWQLDNAYRYLNEAYGGYHFDALHGINVDAGIFLSYVGLFSFYQFDN